MNFLGDNPGAVQYGNFINYYQFHPPKSRMKLFPTNIWTFCKEKLQICLDIGCNAGDLTVSLLEFLENCVPEISFQFLGIDIDPVLIERAKETNNYKNQIKFECLDFMDENSCCTSLISYLEKFTRHRFNITFCLSVTMWIHLNHGDEGLQRFLIQVCEISDMIVVEPQPWKCYRTALKRLKQANGMFPKFNEIKVKQNVEDFIETVLREHCGFEKVTETSPTKWGRRILFYRRNDQIQQK